MWHTGIPSINERLPGHPRQLWVPNGASQLTGLLALFSLLLSYLSPVIGGSNGPASFTLWLPIALIYASALTVGWRALPGIMLGAFLSELVFGAHGVSAAMLLSLGDTACASVLAAWADRQRSRLFTNGQDTLDVLASPGLFALSIAVLAAGSLPNAVAGGIVFKPSDVNWPSFAAQFVLGDLGGAVLLGPLFLVFVHPLARQWSIHQFEFLFTAVFSIVLVGLLLSVDFGLPGWVYLCLLLATMLGVSARYTQAQSITVCSAVAMLMIAMTGDGTSALLVDERADLALADKGIASLFLLTSILFTTAGRALHGAVSELRQTNQVLLRAESVARVGSWRYDLQTHRVFWSPQTYELYGVKRDDFVPSYEKFLLLVHPEDRNDVELQWQAALAGEVYDVKFRITVAGEVRWMRGLAEFEFDASNRPVMAWGTIQDISQERSVIEAEAARARAEVSSRTKSQFLATLSHEIRTPLNGVIGLARIAREKDLPQQLRLDYLRLLEDTAETLNTVISDVLDISKIESGRMELESVAFSLGDLLASLAKTYRLLAEDKGLDTRLDMAADLPQNVMGDPTRLRQVLNNYLSNALKFTSMGCITLIARQVGEQILFEVQDTGIGVEPDVAERLFDSFYQADASNTRRFGGTGLGLAICRELATLMGGEVGLRSEAGKGSTFWLRVPKARVETQGSRQDLPAVTTGAMPEPVQPLRGLNILMAEDNRVNALVAVRLLERAGARVVAVEDGKAAVDAVWKSWGAAGAQQDGDRDVDAIDMVLMDVHMPVMDGLDAARTIRSLEAEGAMSDRLPILAMTAGVLTEQVDEALDAGMDDFISKPLNREQLLETVLRHTRCAV